MIVHFIVGEEMNWQIWHEEKKMKMRSDIGRYCEENAKELDISNEDFVSFLATCWRGNYASVSLNLKINDFHT